MKLNRTFYLRTQILLVTVAQFFYTDVIFLYLRRKVTAFSHFTLLDEGASLAALPHVNARAAEAVSDLRSVADEMLRPRCIVQQHASCA
jgi:hypothetical protein